MSFNVVELDDPGEIRTKAGDIRSKTEAAADVMSKVKDTWSPLGQYYLASESTNIVAAMNSPAVISSDLDRAGRRMKSALEDYASDLDELKERRKALIDKINDYEAMSPDDDDESGQEEKKKLRKEIETEVDALASDKDDIQNRCRDRIMMISIGVSFAAGADVKVPRANEASGENIVRAFANAMWDSVTRSNDLDGRWGPVAQIGNIYFDKWAYIFKWAQRGMGKKVPVSFADARWQMPKTLQKMTAGSFGLLHSAVRWSPLGDSWNPMRTAGKAKGAVETLATRVRLRANGHSKWVAANSISQNAFDDLGKYAKVAGRASSVVGAGVTAATSWQEDSKTHPSMGNGEKAARAGVATGLSVAGGLGGAKAGAVVGGAVGSVIPGAGTAVGAVIGGFVGGVAGGMAGGWAGDKAKEGVSSLKG